MTQKNFRKLFPGIGKSFRKSLWVMTRFWEKIFFHGYSWNLPGNSFRKIPWVTARFLEIVSGICLYGLINLNEFLWFLIFSLKLSTKWLGMVVLVIEPFMWHFMVYEKVIFQLRYLERSSEQKITRIRNEIERFERSTTSITWTKGKRTPL